MVVRDLEDPDRTNSRPIETPVWLGRPRVVGRFENEALAVGQAQGELPFPIASQLVAAPGEMPELFERASRRKRSEMGHRPPCAAGAELASQVAFGRAPLLKLAGAEGDVHAEAQPRALYR